MRTTATSGRWWRSQAALLPWCLRPAATAAVPICKAGQQLDIDLFICRNCTGNTISLGGTRANGPYQPFCFDCPTFTAAVNRTQCFEGASAWVRGRAVTCCASVRHAVSAMALMQLHPCLLLSPRPRPRACCPADACPPPDAFQITCRQAQVPACGPGAKPFLLDSYCTASPPGAQLQWARANIAVDPAGNAVYSFPTSFFTPPVVTCPAAANGTNVWWPVITAFKGRTNCFCTSAATCRFAQTAPSPAVDVSGTTTNPNINITVHGEPRRGACVRMLASGLSAVTAALVFVAACAAHSVAIVRVLHATVVRGCALRASHAPSPLCAQTRSWRRCGGCWARSRQPTTHSSARGWAATAAAR
jgi:hypothetical protein